MVFPKFGKFRSAHFLGLGVRKITGNGCVVCLGFRIVS